MAQMRRCRICACEMPEVGGVALPCPHNHDQRTPDEVRAELAFLEAEAARRAPVDPKACTFYNPAAADKAKGKKR